MVKVFSPAKIRSTTTARTRAANAARANQLCFDEGRSVWAEVVIEPPPRDCHFGRYFDAIPSKQASHLPARISRSRTATL